MEHKHKHKLLATASSQPQGACTDDTVDRFSNLPDEIAHLILSLVNFKDLVRVGSVSKRGKNYYLSTPSLKISLFTEDVLNSFERFLIHRRYSKIQYFTVQVWLSQSYVLFRVITWIHIAIKSNVEVLDLRLKFGRQSDEVMLDLPSSIFYCGSLRSLTLSIPAIFKPPSSASSTNLQHLNLRNVKVDEGFFKWISSCCKYIKELQLYDVRSKNITIESSSLESFTFVARLEDCNSLNISCEKLQDIHLEWDSYESYITSLNIFAPNLKNLYWSGKFQKHQNLGNLMCLEKAEILLVPKFLVTGGYDSAYVFEVLRSICRVKVLILNEETIMAMFREDSVPVVFHDISVFCMNIMSMSDDLVPAMVSLLKRMPNLNSLKIKIIKDYGKPPKACGYKRKYWESQNLDFVYQLKELKIEFSNGYNGMEFAKYILEHARSLINMVIVYQTHQSYAMKKVNNCKMVSNARVVFRERKN